MSTFIRIIQTAYQQLYTNKFLKTRKIVKQNAHMN